MGEQIINPEWRRLNARERDILVTLALEGPCNGNEMHVRLTGPGLDKAGSTRHALRKLDDRGYIRRVPGEEQAKINKLTMQGVAAVRQGVLEPASEINDRSKSLADANRGD